MDYFTLKLDMQDAVYSLGIMIATLVQYMIINFMGGRYRTSFFTTELMHKHFGDFFKKRIELKPPKGGAPDCGNGLHALKLTYGQWF